MIKKIEENMKCKKYSVKGKLTKWNKEKNTVEEVIIDNTSSFLNLIYDMHITNNHKCLFEINGLMTYIEGNSHDETYITNYHIFNSNTLWGNKVDVESSLHTETNVFCYGRKSGIYPEETIKAFVTYNENHYIIKPIIKCNASIMNSTVIEKDVILIYAETEEIIDDFAKVLELEEIE